MKTIVLIVLQLFLASGLLAQNFETAKSDTADFEGISVEVGGDFALQFQSLSHSSEIDTLYELTPNFNLPTANLNLNVDLYDGMKLHMRTYLSSRHHTEAWVKGGYMRVDKLDFIKKDFLSGLMEVVYIKVGLDEINYGDAHFRRSDNAATIHNPFVGNYIMDAFSTEAFGEVTALKNGLIAVVGVSNGKLNQNVVVNSRYNGDNELSLYSKLGYDKQLNDNMRTRLTASFYTNHGTTTGNYLYGSDRTGSRYYSVMVVDQKDDVFTSGRFNPRFSQITAVQVNPFVKIYGAELFGIYEIASAGEEAGKGSFSQIAAELIYRFGGNEQLYAGGRYNVVSGKATEDAETVEINRLNFGAGWFITDNVLTKAEYVQQKYEGDGWIGTTFQGGEFNGFVIEAVISF